MLEEKMNISKGVGTPLGISKRGKKQWQFSVPMERGKEIQLLLFETGSKEPKIIVPFTKKYLIGGVYSVVVNLEDENITEYCYSVNGKLRMDAYAKQVVGNEQFGPSKKEKYIHGFLGEEGKPISEPLDLQFHEMIMYRLHVRGFTMHASSKVKNRGTFRGIEEKIPYLKSLGVNTLLLMPCYEFDENLPEEEQNVGPRSSFLDYTKGLDKETDEKNQRPKVNFWGFTKKNCYFAPKASYASNPKQPVKEMKQMVKKLHDNGIAVLMEIEFTGGINQSFIVECLRYWVREYAIDGFKINTEVVDGNILAQDPYLQRTKFLATYWNTSYLYDPYEKLEEKTLAEYNDGFMVDCRRFLKSDEGQVNAFLSRMRRNPNHHAVINYISNHNGFTLMDLVSYDVKHNEANGEQNMDGTEYNYSWNCGWEGPTRKTQVTQLRLRQIKNALVFVLLGQGVPMLMAGDEFGNTQKGNNNAYCQDNEIGWVVWNKQVMNQRILNFAKKLIALRKAHPVFTPKDELRAMDYIACGCPDFSMHGTKPWYPDLSNYSRVLGIMLCGKFAPISIRKSDKSYYLAYNMHWEEHKFELPVLPKNKKWRVIEDTYRLQVADEKDNKDTKASASKGKKGKKEDSDGILEYNVKPRTVVIFEEI